MTVHAMPTNARQEFRAGWRPLFASAIGLGLGLSPIPAYTAGIMALAMNKQFGWSRADIMGTLTLAPIALLLAGPWVGRLVDKHGPRKVALVSTVGLALSQLLIAAIATSLVLFYVGWAVLAVTAIGTLPLTYAKVINGWFNAARGMALGIALAATGLTGALFPAFLTWLLSSYGWRAGYIGMAALPLLVALPVLWLWLRMPEEAGAGAAVAAPKTGLSVKAALRGHRFWLLAAGALTLSFGVGGLLPNLFLLMIDRGVAQHQATSAMAMLAISVTAGRLLSGFLLDHLWAPAVCAVLVLPALVALALLAQPGMTPAVMVASVVTIGLLGGAEFDLVAIMTGRYFGQRHFSELYGIQYAVFGVGAGFSPATYSALHDRLGSYTASIYLSMGLLMVAVGLFLSLGRYRSHAVDEDLTAPADITARAA